MIPEPPIILLKLLVDGAPPPSLFGIDEYRTERFFEAELARLVIAFSTAVVHILENRLPPDETLFIIHRIQPCAEVPGQQHRRRCHRQSILKLWDFCLIHHPLIPSTCFPTIQLYVLKMIGSQYYTPGKTQLHTRGEIELLLSLGTQHSRYLNKMIGFHIRDHHHVNSISRFHFCTAFAHRGLHKETVPP